jgi:hypothetical protein
VRAFQVVCQFEMPLPVYCISLSPIATRHALVAAGSGDQKVRLCDPMTGGSTHCLLGTCPRQRPRPRVMHELIVLMCWRVQGIEKQS